MKGFQAAATPGCQDQDQVKTHGVIEIRQRPIYYTLILYNNLQQDQLEAANQEIQKSVGIFRIKENTKE